VLGLVDAEQLSADDLQHIEDQLARKRRSAPKPSAGPAGVDAKAPTAKGKRRKA
jgi:hypothetical protein